MSTRFRSDHHVSPREPVPAERRGRWLHGGAFTDGGGRWRPTAEVHGPLGSPTWWLAHAHGFLVDDEADRPVGVVEDVRLDRDAERACALVVVQGWGHPWLVIPVDAVTGIAPGERRLTVVRPATLDGWLREGEQRRARLPRRLRGALRVVRRLVPGLR